jgi:hypothetical protein
MKYPPAGDLHPTCVDAGGVIVWRKDRPVFSRVAKVMCVVALAAGTLSAAESLPKVLKPRLIVGDPVWREMPIRADLQGQYDRVWQTAVDTVLEHNYEIATMDRSSGYLRTIPKADIVRLKTDWYYKVQVSVKLVTDHGGKPDAATVTKVRLQVAGEVTNVDPKNGLKAQFNGYDQVILQTLFQDLQAKLGAV